MEQKYLGEIKRIYNQLLEVESFVSSVEFNNDMAQLAFNKLDMQSIMLNSLAQSLQELNVMQSSKKSDPPILTREECGYDILVHALTVVPMAQQISDQIEHLKSYTREAAFTSYDATRKIRNLLDDEFLKTFKESGDLENHSFKPYME